MREDSIIEDENRDEVSGSLNNKNILSERRSPSSSFLPTKEHTEGEGGKNAATIQYKQTGLKKKIRWCDSTVGFDGSSFASLGSRSTLHPTYLKRFYSYLEAFLVLIVMDSGWLLKQGNSIRKGWRPRWFWVDHEQHSLKYAEKQGVRTS